MFKDLSPQSLLELTHNYYGVRAALSDAEAFMEASKFPTPGSFLDWLRHAARSK